MADFESDLYWEDHRSSITSIIIENGVTTIGTTVFFYCINLTSVSIGSSLENIGIYAFQYCNNLTSFTCKAAVPPHLANDGDVFLYVPKNIPVCVPAGSVAAYQAAEGWKLFTNISDCVPPAVLFDFEGGFPYGTTFVHGDCRWEIGDSTDAASTNMKIPNHHGNFAYANDDKCDDGGDMYNVWLKLPPVSFAGVSNPVLKFDNYRYRDADTCKVNVSTDGTSWTNVAMYTNNTVGGVSGYGNFWQQETVNLSAYANQPQVYIAFSYSDGYEQSYGWAIDNIIVSQACSFPYGLAADVAGTSATVSWYTNESSSFEVKYGYAGERLEDLTTHYTAGGSFTINNLVPSSTYWVYVRSACGSSQSSWIGPVWIKTANGTVNTKHWFESFEITEKVILEQELSHLFPWINIDNDGDGFKWKNVNWSPHGGFFSATSQSYSVDTNGYPLALTPDNYLISPKITIPDDATSATLKFWVAAQSASRRYEHYEVKISTSGTAVGNFLIDIHSETLQDSAWKQVTLNLSQYRGNDIHIAFVHNNSTNQFYLKIDDVSVDVAGETSEPAVTGLLPANDATGVGTSTEVSVTFSSTVTAGNLSGITINGVSAAASVNGNKLVISHADFSPNTFYMVNIPANAVNGYSNAIQWSFTTGNDAGISTVNKDMVTVYPNPVTNTLNVRLEKEVNDGSLTLFDMNGKMVLSQTLNGNYAQINMSQLNTGSYVLHLIENGTASSVMHVVKE
jgi:hypothetical protein